MFELNKRLVKVTMIAQQMTIRGLARKAQISEVTAAKVIKDGKATGEVTGKIAGALGLSPEEILKEGDVE